eukprot:4048556-Pyramimonas_sp.AAC.1
MSPVLDRAYPLRASPPACQQSRSGVAVVLAAYQAVPWRSIAIDRTDHKLVGPAPLPSKKQDKDHLVRGLYIDVRWGIFQRMS